MSSKLLWMILISLAGVAVSASQVVVDYRVTGSARETSGHDLMRSVTQENGVLRRTSIPVSDAPRINGSLQVGDELKLMLFDDKEVILTLNEKTPSPLGGLSFLAVATGYEGVKNAVVVQTEDGLQIDIQDYLRSMVYSVFSTKDGVTVKEMRSADKPRTCGKPLSVPKSSASALPVMSKSISYPSGSSAASKETFVDLLIVYEKLASDWVAANGGAVNFAEVAVQKMNTALANTGLDAHFRFRLVGVREVEGQGATGYTDGTVLGRILEFIVYDGSLNGYNWGAVKAMRDEVDADIACVLADTGFDWGTTGIGYSLDADSADSFSESAYNCCAIRAVANSHTMTHEVGHNMGAGHSDKMADKDNCGPQYYPYSSGYYFYVGSEGYFTIMGYNYDGYGNSYSEVPYFSSPDYYYKGVRVGDSTHNNSLTLKNNFLSVSRYRGVVDAADVGDAVCDDAYAWKTSAPYPWSVITDAFTSGSSAARSCEMSRSSTSWLSTEVIGPATLSFDYQLRTYGGSFAVTCDSDVLFKQENQAVFSMSWTKKSASIPAGRHVIKFSYTHPGRGFTDGWGNGVRLDNVVFTGGTPAVSYYVISFNADGGVGAMARQRNESGCVYALPKCTFTPPAGKRFAGWRCSNGRRYDDGVLVFDLADPGRVVTMTAVWEE